MVRGERDLRVVTEQVDRLGEVAGPRVRVAHQGAPQREQVVQGVGGVLGHAQRPALREVEVHLGRRLRAGSHLEDHADPVDGLLLAGGADLERGADQRDRSGRGGLPEAGTDLAARSPRKGGAVHVPGAPTHRRARVDVLRDGVLDEPGGSHDDHPPGVDVLLGDDALDPAEVVDVGVRVDHPGHRPVTAMLAVDRQRRRGGLGRDQRVDHDDPGAALDEGDVRQVEPADLVDALGHLEQALDGDEAGLPPQARVRRVGCVGLQEGVGVVVPHHAAVGRADHARFEPSRRALGWRPRSPGGRRRATRRRGLAAARRCERLVPSGESTWGRDY